MPDDRTRLHQAKSGDSEALSQLLSTYGPPIQSHLDISPAWSSSLDPSDVMQVTYLEAFLRIGQLATDQPEGFAAWLSSIAQNNLRDAIKSLTAGKRPDPRRRVTDRPDERSYTDLLERIGASSATASQKAAAGEARSFLDDALNRLPESYQTVIRLYDLEGRGAADVGEALERSAGSVYMMRARALDQLRELLGRSSQFFSD